MKASAIPVIATICVALMCVSKCAAQSSVDVSQLMRDVEGFKANAQRLASERHRLQQKESELEQQSNGLDREKMAIEQLKQRYRRSPNESLRAHINSRVAAYNQNIAVFRALAQELQRRNTSYNHAVDYHNRRGSQLQNAVIAAKQTQALATTRHVATKPATGNQYDYTRPTATGSRGTTPRSPRLGFDESMPGKKAH